MAQEDLAPGPSSSFHESPGTQLFIRPHLVSISSPVTLDKEASSVLLALPGKHTCPPPALPNPCFWNSLASDTHLEMSECEQGRVAS